MKQTIAFRVDSGREIGTGHLIRCRTIGEALRKRGISPVFITRPSSESSESILREEGFEVAILPEPQTQADHNLGLMHGSFLSCSQNEDATETLQKLASLPGLIGVVVDHYGIYRPWDEIVSKKYKIFKIDDLADRDHSCAGLIDQNFYADMDSRYRNLVPQNCITLTSPRFAILRPQFRDIDFKSREKRPLVRILVSFGGTDHKGHGLKVTSDLLTSTPFQVSVMGRYPANFDLQWQSLKEAYGQRLIGPSFHVDPLNEMLSADLYIGAGGTITWERFAAGLPGLVYSIAQNQIRMAEDLERYGYQQYAGPVDNYDWRDLETLLGRLTNHETRWALSKKISALVDGHGVDRIIQAWGLQTIKN